MADEDEQIELRNSVIEKIQKAARMHLSAIDEIVFLPIEEIETISE